MKLISHIAMALLISYGLYAQQPQGISHQAEPSTGQASSIHSAWQTSFRVCK